MPLYAAAIVDYCDIREIEIAGAQRRTPRIGGKLSIGSIR
jgi:hypothetical protein